MPSFSAVSVTRLFDKNKIHPIRIHRVPIEPAKTHATERIADRNRAWGRPALIHHTAEFKRNIAMHSFIKPILESCLILTLGLPLIEEIYRPERGQGCPE